MDMLRVFFEISDEDTSKYFADKAIWKCGEEYRSHQGKYPVIFLTFKDVKFDNWDDNDIFIPNLMLLSPTYAEYKKALDNVNDRMCRELGLYYDSNYNLVIKKDNSK